MSFTPELNQIQVQISPQRFSQWPMLCLFFHLTILLLHSIGFKVGGLVSVLAENFVRSFVRKNLFCFLGLFVLLVLLLVVVERGIFNMVQSVLFLLLVVVVLPYEYRART